MYTPPLSLINLLENLPNREFNYETALLTLREAADTERGIKWHVDDTTNTIIRSNSTIAFDHAKLTGVTFSRYDYLQQIVNLYRAASEVAVLTGIPIGAYLQSHFRNRAINALENMRTGINEDECRAYLRKTNTEACTLLKRMIFPQYTVGEISSLLRTAESFASLGEEKHYRIATTTKIGNKVLYQENTPITTLTTEQKECLQNYRTENWYRSLHPVEKALFEKHKDTIVAGTHIIPTLLRNIPGLRNAYKKTVKEFQEDIDDDTIAGETLGSYIHSASISGTQGNTKTRREVAKQTYQQLCSANPGKEVDVLVLCSRIPGQGIIDRFFPRLSKKIFDTYVVDTTENAVGKKNLIVIPTNALRCISKNTIGESCDRLIKAYLEKYDIQGQPEYRSLSSYLSENVGRGSLGYRHACRDIEKMATPKERRLAHEMVELRRLQLKQRGFGGRLNSLFETITAPFRKAPRNKNARIASKLPALWEKVQEDRVLCVSCKSGKDRTGYIAFLADSLLIEMNNPILNPHAIQSALVETSHIQFLPSTQGGKPGCFGLKGVAVDRYDGESFSTMEKLFKDTAKYSSNIALDKIDESDYTIPTPTISAPTVSHSSSTLSLDSPQPEQTHASWNPLDSQPLSEEESITYLEDIRVQGECTVQHR